MSDPVRVGLVVEGPTDLVALSAVIRSLLGEREFVPTPLQPELSAAFETLGSGGWTSIYLWCRQAVEQTGGPVSGNPLFLSHDMLVIQVDADVAAKRYSDDQRIANRPNDLPCEQPCPPPRATTDALRNAVLGWMGEVAVPQRVVLCTPSKSLETWVLVALFPQDAVARSAVVECRPNVEALLQAKPLARRLIRSGQKLIEKYRDADDEVSRAWPYVRTRCSEAERFSQDFLAALPAG